MDKERENKTLSLAELLNNSVLKDKFNKNAYSNVAKQATIFSYWDNIVGKKLANISKPYRIKDSKLFISTKSATVSQQILLLKNKIIEKINTYSKPLGYEVKEISVSYKNYEETTNEQELPKEEEIIWIDEKELEKVKLDNKTIESVKNSVSKIKAMSEAQKENLTKKILNGYKAEIYRKNIENV